MDHDTPTPSKTASRPNPRRRRLIKWAAILAACTALYALAGFVILPHVARSMLPEKLGQALGREASVRDVRCNPFTLTVEVEGLKVLEPDGEKVFASLELLHVQASVRALFRMAAGLTDLRLVEPYVHVAQETADRYNFSDILEGKGGEAEAGNEAPGDGGPFPLLGSNLVIQGGRVEFEDRVRGVTHVLEDLDLAVPFVSTLPGDSRVYVQPALSARLDGRPLALEGRTRPFEDSLRTELNLTLDQVDLTRYRPYLPVSQRLGLASGALSCDLSLVFMQRKDGAPRISVMGPVRVSGLETTLDGAPLAGFKELLVRVGGVNLDQGLVSLDEVRLSAPHASVVLDEQGQPLVAALVPQGEGGAEGQDEVQATDAGPGFRVRATRVALLDGDVSFDDRARGFKARVAPLALALDGLDTAGGDAAFSLDAGLDGSPLLAVQGALDVAARSAGGRLSLAGLQLTRLAPYYAEALPVELLSGTLGTKLEFAVQAKDDGVRASVKDLGVDLADLGVRPLGKDGCTIRVPQARLSEGTLEYPALTGAAKSLNISKTTLRASGKKGRNFGHLETLKLERISFDAHDVPSAGLGSLTLSGLSVRAPGAEDAALALDALSVSRVSYQGKAPSLGVDAVSLRAPRLLAVLDAGGISNVQRILAAVTGLPVAKPQKDDADAKEEKQPAEAKPQAEESPQDGPGLLLALKSLDIKDGGLGFRDEQVSPAYSTHLKDFSGSLAGFSNAPGAKPATLRLSGMVDGHAPLAVETTFSPTDLGLNPSGRLTLTDLGLTGFSPYTAKFVSYTLGKGQLSVSLDTQVQGRELSSETLIRLRGIELGQYAKSPDDVGLPLPLALALLTDRSGNVELDVPVRGSLDNPDFRLGKVIVKAVMNILFKAVTSPFALIGGLFGGGEDLNALAMAAGSSDLTPAAADKLDTMAKALAERPGLKVEVAGTVSQGTDREALSALAVRRAVNMVRFLELEKKGQAPQSVDQIGLTPAEYPEYLREAFDAAEFEKPDEVDDLPEEQAVPAMERLLKEHLAATDQDVAELGRARALAVKDGLVARGVEPGRVFLREATDKDAAQAPTGAALSLR